MSKSAQIVATYRDSLPAWVTEERLNEFLAEAPQAFNEELQIALIRADVMKGHRSDVPDLIVEYMAGRLLRAHGTSQGPESWEGLTAAPIEEYAKRTVG